MDINRFTEKLQEAIRSAQSTATRYGHQQIDVEHLLAALLEQEGGLATSILGKAAVNAEPLQARLQSELERLPKVSGTSGGPDQVYVTPRLNRLLTKAEDEARKLKDKYISVESAAGCRGRLRRRRQTAEDDREVVRPLSAARSPAEG